MNYFGNYNTLGNYNHNYNYNHNHNNCNNIQNVKRVYSLNINPLMWDHYNGIYFMNLLNFVHR